MSEPFLISELRPNLKGLFPFVSIQQKKKASFFLLSIFQHSLQIKIFHFLLIETKVLRLLDSNLWFTQSLISENIVGWFRHSLKSQHASLNKINSFS
ncbi:hypothetical protein BpHYR1_031364 [Brachionus plicatilis]|uniref:Uncharacterized protein n=1 Tax=Brachionus plicatilis TaxID=10195 RepID=A0A3M7P8Y3_BRAPC|nr:hypothetical protein BpHYR1_031364 [Brachionus plicatilis]